MKISSKFLALFLCFSQLFISGCAQPTQKEQILITKDKVIEAILQGSEKNFRELVGVPLNVIGKNEEMLHNDFIKLTRFFVSYKESQDVLYTLLEQPNDMGQKAIHIPLGKGTQPGIPTSKLILELYFGPPNINALDKLSGYDIVSAKTSQ